ncbi:MAG TPA: RNA polymerase sigma factor [Ornithinimicrobium sp.]|nr:RNA polymerase sigma factor [Ornithinimicrobium sp.]
MSTITRELRPHQVRLVEDDGGAEADVREVYLAYFSSLAGWASYLVGDPDLGHDMATDAFVRLLRAWDDVEQPRPWLYTTVGNLVKDHWRKRGRERTAYTRLHGGTDPETAVDHRPDPALTLSVRAAVESLPDRLRLAVLLHYFGDLTVAEVARQLGKAEGTVKRDLHDARARLAQTLESAR